MTSNPKYHVLPAWMVRNGVPHEDAAEAAVAASQLTTKDGVPRVVVMEVSHIAHKPGVHVVIEQVAQFGEVARG